MFTKETISKYIEERKILVQKHPTAELYIYNYSKGVQYEQLWDEVTLSCRGLILDADFNIVSRPFEKFFNYEEPQVKRIPWDKPFKVYDKMDGSLGVSYKLDGEVFIASRGSFESPQAIEANKILHEKYLESLDKFEDGKTYLFEIIYPSNRIVVDYGEKRELVLLGVIDNGTGNDCPLVDIGIPIVEEIEWSGDAKSFQDLDIKNKEGGIFVFANGFRMKVKFADYCRLHRILTGINNIDLWKMRVYEIDPVRHKKWEMTLDGILDKAPDEFYYWIESTLKGFDDEFNRIDERARNLFSPLRELEQKEFALKVNELIKFDSNLVFSLRSGNMTKYKLLIMKSLRPEHSTPFMIEEDN